MTASRRHRALRHGCDCEPCVAKQSEWDRMRARLRPPPSWAKARRWSDELKAETAQARPGPHVLYRFFDDEGNLLYVGITNNPLMRTRAHERTSTAWFGHVATATFEHFPSRAALEAAECRAIRRECPPTTLRESSTIRHGRGSGYTPLGYAEPSRYYSNNRIATL